MSEHTKSTNELGEVYEAVGLPADTNTMAVLSLVAGVGGWIVVPIAGAVVAIVLGHIARSQIARSDGSSSGGAFALGGLVLGYTQIALSAIAIVLLLMLSVVAALR